MSKIHDWNRLYWRNASGEREYNPEELDVDEETLAVYHNSRGDEVEYRTAGGEDDDFKYEVLLNGESVEDITLDGENYEDEEFERLTFGTRRSAREAASDLMRQLPTLEPDEDGDYQYDALQAWAKVTGIPANQGQEQLQSEIVAE